LTGDQRQRNDITNGQQLIRHADRPSVFYFSPLHFFLNSILAHPANGTTCPDLAGFGFAPTAQSNPKAKPKGPFFFNALFGSSKLLTIFVNLFR